ncbi:MAG: alpha/beta fold hydrolase [Patescibacteria group bacterium]
MPEKINFLTEDKVTIIGDYYNAKSSRVALLLHMMPATKESWQAFAEGLLEKEISSLAIDLRGHGQSLDQIGQVLNYQNFGDLQHQASAKDVEAALTWLKNRGFKENNIAIVGASIGANLALQEMGYKPEYKIVVAISAGSDYRGIQPAPFISSYKSNQRILFIASHEDTESAIASQSFFDQTQAQKKLIMLDNAGHGTNIFLNSPQTLADAISWLNLNLPK